MQKFVHDHAVIIAISLSFYVFGFVIGAGVFNLAYENVLTVFVGGFACGTTILLTTLMRDGLVPRLARSA